jgi:hypothetical protein
MTQFIRSAKLGPWEESEAYIGRLEEWTCVWIEICVVSLMANSFRRVRNWKLQKMLLFTSLSPCLSFFSHVTTEMTERGFIKYNVLGVVLQCFGTFHFRLKSLNNSGRFTWRPECTRRWVGWESPVCLNYNEYFVYHAYRGYVSLVAIVTFVNVFASFIMAGSRSHAGKSSLWRHDSARQARTPGPLNPRWIRRSTGDIFKAGSLNSGYSTKIVTLWCIW